MNQLSIKSNLTGIDYKLVDKFNNLYTELFKYYESITIDKIIINQTLQTQIEDIIRLEPPYMILCSENNICHKSAGFQQLSTNKYYCWFHMHSKYNQ